MTFWFITPTCRLIYPFGTNSLIAKLTKCLFGQDQVKYLGHVVTSASVIVDPVKIDTTMKLACSWQRESFKWILGID